MLFGIGRGLTGLQDYTNYVPVPGPTASSVLSDTNDTAHLVVHDPTSSFTIENEDDIVYLDERDPAGWPTVNLLLDPSFEGTYDANGVAPNWSRFAPGTTGITYAKDGTTTQFGSASQGMAWTNAGPSTPAAVGLFQLITLPVDEQGNPLIALPYYFSIYMRIVTPITGGTSWSIAVQFWMDSARTQHAGTYSTNLPLSSTGGVFQRFTASGLAQAGARYATVQIVFNSNNATNGGSVLLDGAQLEYGTFGNVLQTPAYVVGISNPDMNGAPGTTLATGWIMRNGPATGLTYTVVNDPAVFTTAQQLDFAAVPALAGTYGIKVSNPAGFYSFANYQLTLTYQVTNALSAGQVRLALEWADAQGNLLGTPSVFGPAAEGVSAGGWQTLVLHIGPQTPNPPPAGAAAFLSVFAGVYSPSATITGTLVIGSFTATPLDLLNPHVVSATTFGRYPTAYCDNTQAGCYTDVKSGLYYRHLRIFGGYIRTIAPDWKYGGSEVDLTLECADYGTTLGEAPATFIVPQQSDANTIKQAFQYAQNQGFLTDIDYTSMVTSFYTFPGAIFQFQTTRDVLTQVADAAPAIYRVDAYKRLWWAQGLSITAPYALSDHPDNATSFPFARFQLRNDTTQAVTTPVIEGSTQPSAGQNATFTGLATTTTSALTANAQITTIAVTATTNGTTKAGTQLTLTDGSNNTLDVVVAVDAANGATSITVEQVTVPSTGIATGATVATTGVVLNTGNPITNVLSASVGGTALTIGQANTNSFADGYTALVDPFSALLTFATSPTNGQAIAASFVFATPLIVRMFQTSASAPGGSIGRPIYQHMKIDTLYEQQSAVDRGQAEIARRAVPVPTFTATIHSPPWPAAVPPQVGWAIPVTFAPAKLSATLLQIVSVTTKPAGNGVILYDLQLGFLPPLLHIHMAQALRDLASQGTQLTPGTVLTDVLGLNDGWVMADSVPVPATQNLGHWGNAGSLWNGTTVWGA